MTTKNAQEIVAGDELLIQVGNQMFGFRVIEGAAPHAMHADYVTVRYQRTDRKAVTQGDFRRDAIVEVA